MFSPQTTRLEPSPRFAYFTPVSFFKRILRFKKETIQQQELRHAQRYPIAAESPLQCVVQLGSRYRSAQPLNLSGSGVSLRLPKDVEVTRGQTCRITFAVEKYQLPVNATIVHLRRDDRHVTIGFSLQFSDFENQQAYLQLLDPIAIGTTLAPLANDGLRFAEPGIITDRYESPADAQLTVWRSFAGQALLGFEFQLHENYVRCRGTPPQLEVYTSTGTAPVLPGYNAPTLRKAGDKSADIRRHFRWVVPHLGKAIPEDVRAFLAQFTT